MSDTMVTLHGWVGGDVIFRTPRDTPVANFRVACTPRVRRNGTWEDGETTWYSVTAWRALAENVRDSVHRGEAVVVHGRLRSRLWSRGAGQPDQTALEVEAVLIGHDLTRGTSAFLKRQRTLHDEAELDAEVADMMSAGMAAGEQPLDSWGNPRPAGPGLEAATGAATEDAAEPGSESAA